MCTATHFDVFSQNKSDQSHSFPSIRTNSFKFHGDFQQLFEMNLFVSLDLDTSVVEQN